MTSFRQEHWSGLPFPSPGDLPDPGIEPVSPMSSALEADSLPAEPHGKSKLIKRSYLYCILCYLRIISEWLTYLKMLHTFLVKYSFRVFKESIIL